MRLKKKRYVLIFLYIHVFQTINAMNCYLKVFVVFVVAVFEFSVYDFPRLP